MAIFCQFSIIWYLKKWSKEPGDYSQLDDICHHPFDRIGVFLVETKKSKSWKSKGSMP